MRVLPEILLRAPLLPVAALRDPAAGLRDAALGRAALRLASPALAQHADERAEVAWRRYGKRAAYRATPQGLLAGVIMARCTDGASAIALGNPEAHLTIRYARISTLGNALLRTGAGWRDAKLRISPSLLRHGQQVSWLAFGDDAYARCLHAEVEPVIAMVLARATVWVAAPRLAKQLAAIVGDAEDARGILLELVADGLLHHDLEPPLVGPPPAAWAQRRLRALAPATPLDPFIGSVGAAEHLEHLAAAWRVLPGADDTGVALATLRHTAAATPLIARAPLERAAQCAPLLFALADALHPPLAEAELSRGVAQACEAASALVGEGLLPMSALHFGHYGVRVDAPAAADPKVANATIVEWLSGAVIACARSAQEELILDEDLHGRLPPHVTPATFELHVQPCTPPPGGREGDDWLLGLHGPAGSSWGRFHDALGAPMHEALASLRAAERALDGDALRLDVAYAPSRELADLCQVPALRDAALAFTSWPEGDGVRPADCAIANEPAGPAHLGVAAAGHAIVVSPLHRVRSTTAAPSVYEGLLADTLLRQHATWAFGWGPLRRAPWLPRVRLHGFVVAPQSWAPPERSDDDALQRWRADQRVPRWVQVGAEDVLLPLDLDDASDRATLRELPANERVYEIWPPLGRELDASGRRVEIIAAVVNDTDAWHRRNQRLASLAIAEPPAEGARASGWRTIKIYAPSASHEAILAEVVVPFVRKQKGITTWFFLPYADALGDHLRVRLCSKTDGTTDAIVNRFVKHLNAAIDEGRLVAVEVGAYRPEHARYRDALPAVEKIFASDSQLVVDLLQAPQEMPPECALVCSYHALSLGLGLQHADRVRLATEALAAYDLDEQLVRDELAPGYRSLQKPLLALLADLPAPYRAHAQRVKSARLSRAARDALGPTLLHLSSVRMCGGERDRELRSLYLWMRALASLKATETAKRRPKR